MNLEVKGGVLWFVVEIVRLKKLGIEGCVSFCCSFKILFLLFSLNVLFILLFNNE